MEKTYDLIIIGSGPAGLSAAIYAQRAGLDTLVLEKEYISGGQVVNTAEVDNYPGLPGMNGYELGMKFRSHADAERSAHSHDISCFCSYIQSGLRKRAALHSVRYLAG